MQLNEPARASSLRPLRSAAIVFGLLLFVFVVLALAQAGSGASCQWKFPKWLGCVLSAHENLAGGLIAASGALIAAWIAWAAVQQQINADRERMMAERVEAERLLADEMIDYAEGMAAAWRLLDNLSEQTDPETTRRFRDATAWDHEEAINVLRRLSVDFEICVPETSEYFSGLWRRTPKAWTLGMYIDRIAGVD